MIGQSRYALPKLVAWVEDNLSAWDCPSAPYDRRRCQTAIRAARLCTRTYREAEFNDPIAKVMERVTLGCSHRG
jgi:hypothetical protein